MKGFDFSSMFGGMNSGLFGSVNLSDYSSIKSGSYKKLLKSYYTEQKDTAQTGSKATKATKKNTIDKILEDKKRVTTQTVDKSGSTQMKRTADNLRAAVETLNSDDLWEKTNGEYDIDKITGAVKSFVSKYNDTLTQAEKMSSKNVAEDLKYMKSMTDTMSKSLEKMGITIGIDGRMTLKQETLKNDDITNAKSLFTGDVSYGSQIADKAASISKDAILSASIYGSNGMLSGSLSGLYDKTV